MRSVAPMRAAKIGYIAVSITLCVIGIVLMAFPDFSVSALGTICGALFILFGIVKLIGYFSKDLYRLAFQYDLAFGILTIALGVVMLARPENVMGFVCVVLGVSILADGLFKIQIALSAKSFGLRLWWLILICAVVTGILGFVLMFRPGEGSRTIMIFAGAALLAEGLLNFDTIITAVKIIKHQQPDIIDAEFYEEKEAE